MPFTPVQFFEVFARYNTAVWPAQILLVGLALAALVAVSRLRAWSGPFAAGVLAFLWAWMGAVYHLGFFRAINPAAVVFGVIFLVQALLFLSAGVLQDRLRFAPRPTLACAVGGLLVAYALVGYPLLGYAAGHRYPSTPTFGLPCPTTIFTLGLLLWTRPFASWRMLAVPVAWALVGTSAAFKLGVPQDMGLGAAAVLAVLVTWWEGRRKRERPEGSAYASRDHA